MPTVFYHRPHHARVVFDGKLSWASAVDLVTTLDTVIETYKYDAVELVVTSPGGDTDALNHVLTSLRERQEAGVVVQTRVASYAASAAAVLATAGDFRTAAPGAKFLFHCVRSGQGEAMTAHVARAVATQVARVDDTLVANLVGGALLAGPRSPRTPFAHPCDRMVLETLWPVVSRKGGRRPRALRALVEAASAYVGRAVKAEDHRALQTLYRRLLRVEVPISADLARALGLVDFLGRAPERVPADASEAGVAVPEWRGLFPHDGVVPRSVLTRHIIVLGETGSGKTRSVVMPVLAALAQVDHETVGAALVIDPKGELAPVLGAVAPHRLRKLTTDTLSLDVMAGLRWSLDADLAAGRWMTAAHKVLLRSASFVPASPARVLLPHASDGDPTGEFFDREGTALAECVLALVLFLLSRPEAYRHFVGYDLDSGPDADAANRAAWADAFGTSSEISAWLGQFDARAQAGFSALALAHWALTGPLLITQRPEGLLFSALVKSVIPAADDPLDEGRLLRERVTSYWQRMSSIQRQFAAVLAAAANVTVDWAAPAAARCLHVGCEPGFLERADSRVDFAKLVSPRTEAAGESFLLFQPARDDLDRLVGIALKASLFQAVLDDPDRARGGDHLPLVSYVADEAHRWISADSCGEQSYLDTCRSYGGVCLLATQSLAAVRYAFASGAAPSQAGADAALSMISTNTATKFLFRTTDPETLARLSELCPQPVGLASLVQVRPPSSLAVGECYVACGDGRFERQRLAPYTGPEAAREFRAARLLPAPEASVAAGACCANGGVER